MNMSGWGGLEYAVKCASENHMHQRDKAGEPYILHVLSVWHRVRAAGGNITAQIVALLHDVVEDTTVTLEQVRYVFGAEVGAAVDAITKRDGETRQAYLERVLANPTARFVKLHDARDNYERLSKITDEAEVFRLAKKYGETFAALDRPAPATREGD